MKIMGFHDLSHDQGKDHYFALSAPRHFEILFSVLPVIFGSSWHGLCISLLLSLFLLLASLGEFNTAHETNSICAVASLLPPLLISFSVAAPSRELRIWWKLLLLQKHNGSIG